MKEALPHKLAIQANADFTTSERYKQIINNTLFSSCDGMNGQMSVDSCCKLIKLSWKKPKIYFKIKVGMNLDTIINLHIAHFSKLNYIKSITMLILIF